MKETIAYVCLLLFCFGSTQLNAQIVGFKRTLAVGESHSFCVDSRNQFNDSGICLLAGERFTFHIAHCARWKDLQIVTDANGWTSNQAPFGTRALVRRMESRRRCPSANWFELVGTIGKNECNHFRIGCGGINPIVHIEKSGRFYAFANDLPSKYRNNSGSIRVTITRAE